MKKLLLLVMVIGLLVCASYSLGGVNSYFIPLRDGKLYTLDPVGAKECGSYKKGEIYKMEIPLGTAINAPYWTCLYDSEGKKVGCVLNKDIQEIEII